MEKFEQIQAEGMVAFKCKTCNSVFLEGENTEHDCEKILDPDGYRDKKYMDDLLNFDVEMPGKKYIERLEEYEKLRELRFNSKVMPIIEQKFPIHAMQHLIRMEFERLLGNTRKMRDDCYEEYNKQRKVGMPLQERRKLLNTKKIEWCDKEEKRLISVLKRFRVRPWRDWRGQPWLTADDYGSIKRVGFKLFISMNLERAYYLPEEKNENKRSSSQRV